MKIFRERRLGALAFSLLLGAGCDGPIDSDEAADTPITSAIIGVRPTVLSVMPFDGDRDVLTDPSYFRVIAATSEPIAASSVSSRTFSIDNGTVTAAGTYNVSLGVQWQPTYVLGPAQRYTARLTTGIRDLEGERLAAAHSWSFTTADGTWRTASEVGQLTTNLSPQPAAANTAGDVVVVTASGGQTRALYTKLGGSSPLALNVQAGVQVAVLAGGEAIAVWREGASLRFSYVTRASSAWAAAADVATGINTFAVAGAASNALVVWSTVSAGQHTLWRRFINGAGGGSAASIGTSASLNGAPRLFRDAAGNSVAVTDTAAGTFSRYCPASSTTFDAAVTAPGNVWALSGDGAGGFFAVVASGVEIRAYRLGRTAGWGTPRTFFTPTSDSGGSTYTNTVRLATDAAGNAVIAWTEEYAANNPMFSLPEHVKAIRHRAASGWDAAATTLATDTAAGRLRVSMAPGGIAAVAFEMTSTYGTTALYAAGPSSDAFAAPVVLTQSAQKATQLVLAQDAQGNAALLFTSGTPQRMSAARHSVASMMWMPGPPIDASTTQETTPDKLLVDGSGKLTATYLERTGAATYRHLARRFE